LRLRCTPEKLKMRTPTAALFLLLHLAQRVVSNTEKAIFRAPALHQPSTLQTFRIAGSLSPTSSHLHTQLAVAFPHKEHPRGTDSWYFLRDLVPGKRYELRVCWLATVCVVHSLRLRLVHRSLAFIVTVELVSLSRILIMSLIETNPILVGDLYPPRHLC